MNDLLRCARIEPTAPSDGAPKWVAFLHGILGTGQNFRSIARNVLAASPGWGALLVDLRMHGTSQGFAPPHTIDACAADLAALTETLSPAEGRAIDAVVGHSFGGKVALAYAAQRATTPRRLDRLVVLDSTPSARRDARASESTVAVIDLLERMPRRWDRREAFVEAVVAAGNAPSFAQWLAMNLRRDGEGFTLRLEMQAIRALLDDYMARDFWGVLERDDARAWTMVVGGRSLVLNADDRTRLARIATDAPDHRSVETLPDAGHWVHVDAPDAIASIVATRLR